MKQAIGTGSGHWFQAGLCIGQLTTKRKRKLQKQKWLIEEIENPKPKTSLINFRVPDPLKGAFDRVCRDSGRNRSAVLIGLMIGLIDEEVIRRERGLRI